MNQRYNDRSNDRDFHRGDRDRDRDSFSRRRQGGRDHRDRDRDRDHPPRVQLPLEQGKIHTLLDNFGFIYCANRPTDVFFHYSELVKGKIDSYDLQIGQEVEFFVGPRKPQRGSGRSSSSLSEMNHKEEDKLSAFQVQVLEPGSVVWEVEEEPKGVKRMGVVETMIRTNPHRRHSDRDRDRDRDGSPPEGTIRLKALEEEEEKETEPDSKEDSVQVQTDDANASANPNANAAVKKGALVRFTLEDYAGSGSGNNNNNSPRPKSRNEVLERNDVIEFTLVTEKRTGMQYARNIVLLQSERKRLEEEREKKMMEEATLEQGVVVSLKNGFGFLRSNQRKEEVYFHFSEIHLPEDEEEEEGGDVDKKEEEDGDKKEEGQEKIKLEEKEEKNVSTYRLHEGQDMEYLVVMEGGGDRGGKKKLAARNVKFLPKGTVEFEKVVAKGVRGVLSLAPRFFNSMNAGRRGGKSATNTSMPEGLGRVQLCKPICLDSSGQVHSEEGADKKEQKKGSEVSEIVLHPNDCRGIMKDEPKPELWFKVGDTLMFDVIKDVMDGTYRAVPTKSGIDESKEETDERPRIRLAALGLMGRAEGIVASIKNDYGFVQLAHRNIDVYFRMSEVLPAPMQQDMMSCEESADKNKLDITVGSEVTFDLSLSSPKARSGSGRNNGRFGGGGRGVERDQLRAQRLAVLPPGSLTINKVEADVTGFITRMKGGYSGQIRLNKKLKVMSQTTQYPLMVKLIHDFASNKSEKVLNFQNVQSEVENDIFADIVATRPGLELQFVSDSDFAGINRGRICIKKVERKAKEENTVEATDDDKDATPDEDLKDEALDTFEVEEDTNIDADEVSVHGDDDDDDEEDQAPGSQTSSKKRARKKTRTIRTVTFERQSLTPALIAEPPMNGDKVSMSITFSRSTGQFAVSDMVLVERNEPIGKAVQYNMCEGYVLLEPVHTSFKASKSRRKSSFDAGGWGSDEAIKSKRKISFDAGGWGSDDKVDQDADGKSNGEGIILLLDDPAGLYKSMKQTPPPGDDVSGEVQDPSCISTDVEAIAQKVEALSMEKDGIHLGQHINYTVACIAGRNVSDTPKRGDLVSFTKGKNGRAKETRIVSKSFAQRVKGRLSKLDLEKGTAVFQPLSDDKTSFDVKLSEVVSCETKVLKEGTTVEGILHDGCIVGICRNADLYLESTIVAGGGKKERPRLNLNVKTGLGGKIIAQSCMAKGPDNTLGFYPGWTTRVSTYAEVANPQDFLLETSLNKDAKPFVLENCAPQAPEDTIAAVIDEAGDVA